GPKQATSMLAALAQKSRLLIFRRLAADGGELAAGELARRLGIPGNTLSFHLKELANAGLIESRRDGRSIKYALHQSNVRHLMGFLWDDCCGGRPELCGAKPSPRQKARRS